LDTSTFSRGDKAGELQGWSTAGGPWQSHPPVLWAPTALWGWQQGQTGPQRQGPAGLWLRAAAQETEIVVVAETHYSY